MDSNTPHLTLFQTAIGDCGIVWRGDIVVATSLPGVSPAATTEHLTSRTHAVLGEPPPSISRAIDAITSLLDGEKTDLSFIPCEFAGLDAFAVDVYGVTRAIPPGVTITYGEVAHRVGNGKAAQAVGRALGRNPFPIVVPCHRVMGANGQLTGFSATGGVETKLKMLAIEGATLGDTPGLFDDLPLRVKPR